MYSFPMSLLFSPKLETKYIGFHIPKFVSVFVETFHQEQTSNNNILQNLHISEDYSIGYNQIFFFSSTDHCQ